MALLHSSTSVFYGFSLLGSMLLQRCWCWGEGGGGVLGVGDTFSGKPSSGVDGWESLPGRMMAVAAEVANICVFPSFPLFLSSLRQAL